MPDMIPPISLSSIPEDVIRNIFVVGYHDAYEMCEANFMAHSFDLALPKRPTRDRGTLVRLDTRWYLARICSISRHWRALARSLPELWSQITICNMWYTANPSLSGKMDYIRTCLELSRESPLDIHIAIDKKEVLNELLPVALRVLYEHSSRWRNLTLESSSKMLMFNTDLQILLFDGPFPQLRHIHVRNIVEGNNAGHVMFSSIDNMPTVESLEVAGHRERLLALPTKFPALRDLHISKGHPLTRMNGILSSLGSLHSLTRLKFDCIRLGLEGPAVPAISFDTLEELQVAQITSRDMTSLLGTIQSPSLSSLVVYSTPKNDTYAASWSALQSRIDQGAFPSLHRLAMCDVHPDYFEFSMFPGASTPWTHVNTIEWPWVKELVLAHPTAFRFVEHIAFIDGQLDGQQVGTLPSLRSLTLTDGIASHRPKYDAEILGHLRRVIERRGRRVTVQPNIIPNAPLASCVLEELRLEGIPLRGEDEQWLRGATMNVTLERCTLVT